MDILFWIVLGLIAGWLASIIMKTDARQGPLTDIILGIVGALIGGFLFNLFGASGVTGFNIYSIAVATLGAVILIWAGRRFV
ncbi:MAG: GlsB/YeaQ/YmgE family stress response membrane protein [Weeksellaceae bacterium]